MGVGIKSASRFAIIYHLQRNWAQNLMPSRRNPGGLALIIPEKLRPLPALCYKGTKNCREAGTPQRHLHQETPMGKYNR